ncbi:MAG: tRNA pseudouridine(55) synthase TruB, partial [Filifactor alocis]|nr:tRNA pseudouridine(55) synthase TruB [Filifactor alocis]
MNGFLNLIKPTGMTSHDVVSAVRRLLKIKKVGHTGTLDPNAAGVLPVCVGRATKFSDYLLKEEKQYFAKIGFGVLTDTLDTYGNIVSEKDIHPFSLQQLKEVLQELTGDIEQLPPKYSAIKVGGRKLYEMARNNEELPEIKARAVSVKSMDICSFSNESVDLDIVCSAGTYIRSLARDIGGKLDNEAYLSLLIRKR